MAGVTIISNCLAALELNAEGAALGKEGGGNEGAGNAATDAAAGLPAATNSAGSDACLPLALVNGIARAIRTARSGRGGSSSDDDTDFPIPPSAVTDCGARSAAHKWEPPDYFHLPRSARTWFPSLHCMKTLRYRDDVPPSEPCAEAQEAK